MAEDNPGDVRLAQEALGSGTVPVRLAVTRNGEEALAYLRREGKYSQAPRPDLILLDLNIPRKNGREVLREIKSDPALDCIPVLILTSSQDESDVVQCYKLHANSYITKPIDLAQFRNVVRAIEDFWLKIARIPAQCGQEGK